MQASQHRPTESYNGIDFEGMNLLPQRIVPRVTYGGCVDMKDKKEYHGNKLIVVCQKVITLYQQLSLHNKICEILY